MNQIRRIVSDPSAPSVVRRVIRAEQTAVPDASTHDEVWQGLCNAIPELAAKGSPHKPGGGKVASPRESWPRRSNQPQRAASITTKVTKIGAAQVARSAILGASLGSLTIGMLLLVRRPTSIETVNSRSQTNGEETAGAPMAPGTAPRSRESTANVAGALDARPKVSETASAVPHPPFETPTVSIPILPDPTAGGFSRGSSDRPAAQALGSAPLDGQESSPETHGSAAWPKETTLFRQARENLRTGHPYEAMRLLDRARQLYPEGNLAQEREALTIEVLVKTGSGALAAERAHAFALAYPDSPHVARVLALVGAQQ